MATSRATTVRGYLAELSRDRRGDLDSVRKVILKNLPEGFEESMQYGMITYRVPLDRYPDTYNGQPLGLASLAAQKSYNVLYLMSVYSSPELGRWFESAYKKSGKKLEMGKSCLRFKSLEDLALDVVGELMTRVSVDDFISFYEESRRATKRRGSPRARSR